MAELIRDTSEVTFLEVFDQKLAAGYSDGNVCIFDLVTKQMDCVFTLHKSAVSCLKYDSAGMKLVSGGTDTDLVVSDVVDQIGKHRLLGHVGAVTSCRFLAQYDDIVVSSSKDMSVKFWTIETQICFKTIADSHSEIWGIELMRNDAFLVTGSKENVLRVYKIQKNELQTDKSMAHDESNSPLKCNFVGCIQRSGKGRTVNLVADKETRVLACSGTDDEIEIFHFCSAEEALARLAKRRKKLSIISTEEHMKEMTLADEIRRLTFIKTKEKVKSLHPLLNTSNELRVGVTFANNLVRMYSLDISQKNSEAQLIRSINLPGHHTECRSVCFSSDNLAVASGSADSLKLWNRSSLTCLRTVDTGYILSSCFVPGDRHVLLGLKNGSLQIVDVAVGKIIEIIPAHSSEIWTVNLLPDKRGCVTGGGDSTVKFWTFELVTDPAADKQKVLSLIHKNTLQLEENVLDVKVTPDGKLVACALLDSTVKLFFMDSFKFFLSLYGHKLPILCMDISYDNILIATGSADRSVKIWGIDHGDCHRSLAHDDSVTGLQFVGKTHMFFTSCKDGSIKQWDADTFNKIITLTPGHIGEAYSLGVSPNGMFVVSSGSDKTIRLFERSDEQLVLEDQLEIEREEAENRMLATGEDTSASGLPSLSLPSKKTVGAEKGAESILECLEISRKFDEDKPIEAPVLMTFYGAKNTEDFLLAIMKKIRASELEESLLLLPFTNVCDILEKLLKIADDRSDETVCRIVLFLFRIHHRPIINNQILLPSLQKLLSNIKSSIVEAREVIGYNIHAMGSLQRRIEDADKVELFKDSSKAKKARDRKQRKQRVEKRLHMHIAA